MASFRKDKNGDIIYDGIDDYDTTPVKDWVSFKLPPTTLMGDSIQAFKINDHIFAPDIEHRMPPKYAEHLQILLDKLQKEAVRRLRPQADMEAVQQQANYGSYAGAAQYIQSGS